MTNNCYKLNIVKQGTGQRAKFHIFYSEHNEKINQVAGAFCRIGWLVSSEKLRFRGAAVKVGEAFFTGSHALASKLDRYIQ